MKLQTKAANLKEKKYPTHKDKETSEPFKTDLRSVTLKMEQTTKRKGRGRKRNFL